MSWVGCSNCMTLYCTSHMTVCDCEEKYLILFKRIEDSEITKILNKSDTIKEGLTE